MYRLSLFLLLISLPLFTQAQFKSSSKTITYEELYDSPYEINKLFVMFQPLYMDLFVTNVNVGFGLEAQYHIKDKFDIHASARIPYSKRFDMAKYNAIDNANVDTNVQNPWQSWNYFEFGATYHINDREEDTDTKIILYSKRYKPQKWAAQVPDHIIIPSKVRKYYGVRLGSFIYNSTTDVNRAMTAQGTTLTDAEGNAISDNARVFGNISATGLYVGGSMSWIKNFAIKPDRGFGVLVNDLYFTTYFDIMFAPSLGMDDIYYDGLNYTTEGLDFSKVGFRGGMEGKFNRQFGWAYSAEAGLRPSLSDRTFYVAVKISIPVFATNLDHEREAFGK